MNLASGLQVITAALFLAAPVLIGVGVYQIAGAGWACIYSGAACLAAALVLAKGLSIGQADPS